MDYALAGPIPWRADLCRRAGTVHLGGSLEEVAASERDVAGGRIPARPFVLLAQQSLFDPTRAPAGQQTAWAYCHVPYGCTADLAPAIEAQIERFAPGFNALVLSRRVSSPCATGCRQREPGGRRHQRRQHGPLAPARAARVERAALPHARPGGYTCARRPPRPAAGVHGMCGYHAARAALARELK